MKTILVLTDFSEKATHVAEYALNLAAKVRADILLYHSLIVPEKKSSHFEWRLEEYFKIEDDRQSKLKATIELLKERSGSWGFQPALKSLCRSGIEENLGPDIKQIVEDKAIWMIIMGSTGDECISNLKYGTNGYSVIASTCCPVLFVPMHAPVKDISRMTILFDIGSENLPALPFLEELKERLDHSIEVTQITPWKKQLDKNKEDVIGLIFRKESLSQSAFDDSTTKLLKNKNLPLLIFPHCVTAKGKTLQTAY